MQPKENYFGICGDESGSMRGIREPAIKAIREISEGINEGSRKESQKSSVTLVTIGGAVAPVHEHFYNAHPASLMDFGETYRPHGMTPLLDGIGHVIERLSVLERAALARGVDAAFMVLVITDGYENQSKIYTKERLRALMQEKTATDRWTFGFQLPPGHAEAFCRDFGFPRGACHEWEATTQGVEHATVATRMSTDSYFVNRTHGVRSTKTFYAPNAANLQKSAVVNNLEKLDGAKVKCWTVKEEITSPEFVREHGHEFVLGALHYKLTKKERVQRGKVLVLQKRGEREYFAGIEDARQMLGLPVVGEINVEPGNHGDWNIYVQSGSINRKLVRGTEVLYRLDVTKPIRETWDSKAAHEAAVQKQEAIAHDGSQPVEVRVFGAVFAGRRRLSDIKDAVHYGPKGLIDVGEVLQRLKKDGKLEFRQGEGDQGGWHPVKGAKPPKAEARA